MSLGLSAEQLEVYRRAARVREVRRREEIDRRRARALDVATEAARLLKEVHGASRVYLFGSLTGDGRLHDRSDIDLAVEGIHAAHFWRAWAALDHISAEFRIDLIDLRFASPALADIVEKRGVEL